MDLSLSLSLLLNVMSGFPNSPPLVPYQPIIWDPPGPAVSTKRLTITNSENVQNTTFGDLPLINNSIFQYVQVGQGKHATVFLGFKNVSGDPSAPKIPVAVKVLKRVGETKQLARGPLPKRQGITVVNKTTANESMIRREIVILKKMRHANIVRLYEVIDDALDEHIYLVLEYMGGGEVKWTDGDENDPRPLLSIAQTRRIMRDVLLGLEYIHYQGVVHRDIKPANILWTDDRRQAKIADFGVSHVNLTSSIDTMPKDVSPDELLTSQVLALCTEEDLYTFIGTPAFLSPELAFRGSPTDAATSPTLGSPIRTAKPDDGPSSDGPAYEADDAPSNDSSPSETPASPPFLENRKPHPITKALDVWALGITFYCFLFGRTPFQPLPGQHVFAVYPLIRDRDWFPMDAMGAEQIPSGPRRPRADDESERAQIMRILDALLQKNPANRMTLPELKNNPWIQKDLPDPKLWLETTSLARTERITVTPLETLQALPNTARSRWWGVRLARHISALFKAGRVPPVPEISEEDDDDFDNKIGLKSAPARMTRKSYSTRDPPKKTKSREIIASKPINIPQSSNATKRDKGKAKASVGSPTAQSPGTGRGQLFRRRSKSKSSKSLRSTSVEKWLPAVTGNSTSTSALQGLAGAAPSTSALHTQPVLTQLVGSPSSPNSTITSRRRRFVIPPWLGNRGHASPPELIDVDGRGSPAEPVLTTPRGFTNANTSRSEEGLLKTIAPKAHVVTSLAAMRRTVSYGDVPEETYFGVPVLRLRDVDTRRYGFPKRSQGNDDDSEDYGEARSRRVNNVGEEVETPVRLAFPNPALGNAEAGPSNIRRNSRTSSVSQQSHDYNPDAGPSNARRDSRTSSVSQQSHDYNAEAGPSNARRDSRTSALSQQSRVEEDFEEEDNDGDSQIEITLRKWKQKTADV